MAIASWYVAAKSGQFCLVLDHDNGKVRSVSVYADQDYVYSEVYGVIDAIKDTHGMVNADPANHDAIHQDMANLSGDSVEMTMRGTRHFHWVISGKHECTTEHGWSSLVIVLSKKFGWNMRAIRNMFV